MNSVCRWLSRVLDGLVFLFALVTAIGLGFLGLQMTLAWWFVGPQITLVGMALLGLSAAYLWALQTYRRRMNGTLAGLFALPLLATALPGSGEAGIAVEWYFSAMVTLSLAAAVLGRREERTW